MENRKTETVTLHFDLSHLSHLPDQQQRFQFHPLGKRTVLKPHTDQTRKLHLQKNTALGAIPAQHHGRFSHFAEDVEMPADAVGLHRITYPSSNPEALTEETAVEFRHIPSHEVRRAVRAMRLRGDLTVPSILAHYGVTRLAEEDLEEAHVQASVGVNYIKTALSIVMSHPELASLVPKDHYEIAESIVAKLPSFTQLWQYLSTHPDSWYEQTYVKDPNGKVMEPAPDLTDKDGNPVKWPTKNIGGKDVPVIPQHNLTGGLEAATLPVLQEALQALKQKPWAQGSHWTTQHGVTSKARTQEPPKPAPLAMAAATPAKADWTVKNITSHYGLDLYADSLEYTAPTEPNTGALKVKVKNWPNRGLGVYVQFVKPGKEGDVPIDDPAGWKEVLPGFLQGWLEKSENKKYLQHIGAGNVFFGVPVWTDPVELSFPMPDEATGVNVMLGGLGHGRYDMDVDWPGLVYTCVSSYGIPMVLSAISVGVSSTKWYMEFFDDTENVVILLGVGFGPFTAAVGAGAAFYNAKAVLSSAAQFVAGLIFSAALKQLAVKVTGYTTSMEIMENVPIVGRALQIASIASAIADMIATSVEVALSPATYILQAKRSMNLGVSVKPDPTHGTSTQTPIWPKEADHWVLTVQYKGGTAFRKAGPMPGGDATPIHVSFAKDSNDALPSAPGQQFQIIADIYSANDWIAGKWVSGWVEAVPTDGDSRNETGSIIEQLVPLLPTTIYYQKEKLNYDGPSKSYVWENTVFSLSAELIPAFNAGGTAPAGIHDAFWSKGVRLSAGATIQVKASGQRWQVNDSGTGVDYSVAKVQIATNPQTGDPIYELEVKNITYPAPPETVTSLPSQDYRSPVDITINDLAYKLGYCYYAKNQNLPLDYGTQNQSTLMYLFESISTLANPAAGMKEPTRGMSVQPYIAYDQFGPAGLFELKPAMQYMEELNQGGDVPANISKAFTDAGYPLPTGAQVTVITASASWRIGVSGETPLYDLRRQVDLIRIFNYPTPEWSPNNFFLDSRTYKTDKLYHLRYVDLHDDSGTTFDYASTKSWGAFTMANIDAICVHPNGFVIAISYQDNKMSILELPDAPVDEKDAPIALPFSGKGVREGLMQGPVGMTITADGRVLVLERDNARIQAFDTKANPAQCFAAELAFNMNSSYAGDLDNNSAPATMLQVLQKNVPVLNTNPDAYDKRYLLAPAFSLDSSYVAVFDVGTITTDLREQFKNHALTLGEEVSIAQTEQAKLWLVEDKSTGITYDVRNNGEGLGEVDIYRGFTLSVAVKAPNTEWIVRDKTNALSFDVKQGKTALEWHRLSALMRLKEAPSGQIVYVDVGVETKGFIYVLSYIKPGDKPSDYRLDIYNPDGTPLQADTGLHNGQINAAKMTVDQWRTVFTLNYQQMQGRAGRPEPTIGQWIATTPTGNDS